MAIRSRAKHRIRRKRLGRPFQRLWVGFTLASTGDGLVAGAVPLMAVVVNPHPLAVSAVVAADSLPWLILALPAGAFADRFRRGPLMAVSNVVRAAAILVGAFLILNDNMTLALLILVVLINAGGRAIYYSALQSMVPDLVKTDAFESANGVLSGTEAGTEHLAGPVIGTWLFAMSRAVPFFADAVALVLSCFPLAWFRTKAPQPEGASTSAWEGARLLFADRRLRLLLIMVGILAGLQGMEMGVLVLLATTEWGIREGAYGVLLAAGAARGPAREPVGQPPGPGVRQCPDADRRRARLGCGIPGHGGGAELGAGRSGLRVRRFRRRCGLRRGHLAAAAAHPRRHDGTGRRCLAGPGLGRRTGRRPRGRRRGRHRRASGCRWSWPGCCNAPPA